MKNAHGQHQQNPEKPRKKGSFIRDAFITLTVLGVLGGGAYLLITHPSEVESFIKSLQGGSGEKPVDETGKTGTESSKTAAGKSEPEKPPADKGEISTPPPARQPPPVEPTPTESSPERTADSASARINKAIGLYKACDFGAAISELSSISARDLSAADRKAVAALAEKCEAFREIVADVEPLELADADGMVVVRLKNGNSVEGRLLKQQGGSVTIQKNHGIKGIFRPDEIDRIEKIGRDEVMKRRKADFTAMAGDVLALSSERLFELAEHCIREGLKAEVVGLLEKGLEKDSLFRAMVYNEKAKRLYRLYLWYKGKKKDKYADKTLKELRDRFPRSSFTAKAVEDQTGVAEVSKPPSKPGPGRNPQPPKPPEKKADPAASPDPWDEEDEDPPEPAPVVPAGSTLLDEAKRWYQAAKRHEENSMPGKPGADAENKKAIEAFQKAIALYEDAQIKHPDKAEDIEELIMEMQGSLFWCKKRQTLD